MPNSPERAKYWQDFICTRCQYPNPELLRAQFAVAELSEFCDCGCNSFKVAVSREDGTCPIAKPGPYGVVFEANFRFASGGKTLEILLFAGEDGNLAYVEIDCCANSLPVPEVVELEEQPFHVHSSSTLAET